MTKKKKQQAKSADGSPSGSASSESSVSRFSAPPSLEMVVEVPSEPSDPASPGAVTATKAAAEDPFDAVNGAVTATESVGVHENPISKVKGAVTATLEEGEFVRPPSVYPATIPIIPVGIVTESVGAHKKPSSEIEGAVTTTLEEGENVPPPSEIPATIPIVPAEKAPITEAEKSSSPQSCVAAAGLDRAKMAANHWRQFVKTSCSKLDPEGIPFTLDSGEPCVKIPNSVIEKNKKSWDSFIIGQFYEDPPARGAVHAIVNGIWSKNRRDISVSKMEGHAFLFRVPCPHARRRILSQCLWQVDGQTMFVAKWAPGVQAEKPELSMVPVWLDFTGVPLQFFNKDALKEIAGLVGHPICLHPSTENLTNIEVAKVYTVIDPRKPLPEAVNAQFENGEVARIQVSSPWLPSLCSHCLKVGHTISKCPTAPRCEVCNSVKHSSDNCTRRARNCLRPEKAPIKSQLTIVGIPAPSLSTIARAGLPKEPSSASRKHQDAAKNNSDRGLRIQEPPGPLVSPSKNGFLVVDLNDAGLHSPRNSAHGSGTDFDSGSDSISADDDNPANESDRFIEGRSECKGLLFQNWDLTRMQAFYGKNLTNKSDYSLLRQFANLSARSLASCYSLN
ncbi:hypothetical protein Bca101_008577 [Brassica carinata]